MPSVDINSPSQSGVGGSKEGFGTGIPTPILLAVVGGGIGLVVFLSRKAGSNTGTGADKNTLLPNTAIMLGSLQQGVLDLQGQVSMGNADLSSQLTGVGENLGTQIDSQTAQVAQSFADLTTYLGSNFQSIAGSQADIAGGIAGLGTNIAANQSNLATAIAGLGTQNASLAQSLSGAINQLGSLNTAQYNEVMGVLTNPWVKQYYQNNIASNLNPYQQKMFWVATLNQTNGTYAAQNANQAATT